MSCRMRVSRSAADAGTLLVIGIQFKATIGIEFEATCRVERSYQEPFLGSFCFLAFMDSRNR